MSNKTYRFNCGCEFNIKSESPFPGGNPCLDIDIDRDVRWCPAVTELLASSKTLGCFQLDSKFSQKWVGRLKPTSIEHLTALVSILRPGTLEATENGVSMTEIYCRRKNNEVQYSVDNPAIAELFKNTYQVLIYQEQIIKAGEILAGFSKAEADNDLRRPVSKKSADKLFEVQDKFIEGCEKVGLINREQAIKIFEWIKKSARYLFNQCISGKTVIRSICKGKFLNKSGHTIEEIFQIKYNSDYAKETGHHELYRKWKYQKNCGRALSLNDDGRIRKNEIVLINYNGKKPLYKITLENGASDEVTWEHKFPTPDGEIKLSEIENRLKNNEDTFLYVCGEYEKGNGKHYAWSDFTREDMKNRAKGSVNKKTGKENFCYTNGSYSEFKENGKIIPKECNKCGRKDGRLELHHIDGDRTNSSLKNLERLCASCHKKKEYAAGRVKVGQKGYPALLCRVKSIEYIGEGDTYNVTMKAPNHTYVTGSNIVHSNSHAAAYAIRSLKTAYLKSHFSKAFFKSKLIGTKDKTNPSAATISDIVNDGKLFNVNVSLPIFTDLKENFYFNNGDIYFGIKDIKGFGDSTYKNIQESVNGFADKDNLKNYTWNELLLKFLIQYKAKPEGKTGTPPHLVSESIVDSLIKAGAFSYFGKSRSELLASYGLFSYLTAVDVSYLNKIIGTLDLNDTTSLLNAIARLVKDGGIFKSQPRLAGFQEEIKLFQSKKTVDSPLWVTFCEDSLLGVPITCQKIDSYDTSEANFSLKAFITGGNSPFMVFAVDLESVEFRTISKGKNIGQKWASVVLSDGTAKLNVAIWSEDCEKWASLLYTGNSVIIRGERGKGKYKDNLEIKQIEQAKAATTNNTEDFSPTANEGLTEVEF